jgi:large subunit ribosomal protein L20
MARVKKGVNAHKKHKKILKLAKGYYGAKSKLYRPANEAVMRALRSAYSGRKQKKRDYRKLWITRINAAARMNGLSYSRMIHGLKNANVEIDRKILADLAMNDSQSFEKLADLAKENL